MTEIHQHEKRIASLEKELAAAREEQNRIQRGLLAAEERANELYLDLIRTQKEAKERLDERDRLLDGLHVLTNGLDVTQVFDGMLQVLRSVLGFEHAFILVYTDSKLLKTAVSTAEVFENLRWEPDKLFRRVLSGHTVATFDVNQIPEWKKQPAMLQEVALSALHVPVGTSEKQAILICTHSIRGYFTRQHVVLADRFAVLAKNALHNADLYAALKHERDTLEIRVAERTAQISALARFPEENPFPVLRVDASGSLQYSNPAAVNILAEIGIQRGNNPPNQWRKLAAKALRKNEPINVELEHLDRYFSGTFAPVKTANYVNVYLEDITDRKKAEIELRDQVDFVLTLVNTMAQGLIVLDDEARLEFVNPALARMLGQSEDDLIGKTPYDLTDSADHERLTEVWEKHKLGQTVSFEARMRGADGREVFALNVGTPRMRDGEFAGTIGVISDLTERRGFEEALSASETKTRLILDTALDAVVEMDDRGMIIGWNQQAETIFGWSAKEVIGRRLSDTIIPQRMREAHENGMRHYEETGEGPVLNTRIEIEGWHKEGREFPVELAITPVETNGKKTFNAFIRDITKRRQAEAALRESEARYREQLEQTKEALADSQALIEVSKSLAEMKDFRLLLEEVVDEVAKTLNADRVTLILADNENRQITQFVGGGPGAALIAEIDYFEFQEGLSGWVLRNKKYALSPKGTIDQRESARVHRAPQADSSRRHRCYPCHLSGESSWHFICN